MQSIRTRYFGPSNYRGSRIIADCDAGRRTFAWNYALGVEENHHAAALAFARDLGWLESSRAHGIALVSGSLPRQSGYAHVLTWGA